MSSKKGISAIVATVLIILITVAAVVIIWATVIPLIKESTDFRDPNLRLDLVASEGYTAYDPDLRLATIQVKRGSDSADLLGFDLIFLIEGNSVKHFISDFPNPNQAKVYYINLSNYSIPPSKVRVAPVFTDGTVGNSLSEFEFTFPEVNLEPLVNNNPDDGNATFDKPNGGYKGGGGGTTTTNPPVTCTSNLINTSWSAWINQTECRVNNTLLQNRSLVEYDTNNCVSNITFVEYNETSCVGSLIVGANTYYVSVNGNGSHNGSLGHEMTLQDAKVSALPGDTFLLLPGNYPAVTFQAGDGFGNSTHWIDYQSYPNRFDAKFVGSIELSGAIEFNMVLDGIEVYVNRSNLYGIKAKIEGGVGSNLKIINSRVHGNSGTNNVADSMDGPSAANIALQYMDNVSVENTEVYYGGYGMTIDDSSNVTVRDCTIHHQVRSGIRTGGGVGPFLYENNTLHDHRYDWGVGVHASGFEMRSSNIILRDNTIYDYGNTQPIMWYHYTANDIGYQNCSVENNLVYTTNTLMYPNTYVQIIDLGRNFTIKNNTFTGGLQIYTFDSFDGSSLYMYNNLFSYLYLSNSYYVNLLGQSCVQANSKWANIQEGDNIYGALPGSVGNNYLCLYDLFNGGSDSHILDSIRFADLFQDKDNYNFHPKATSLACNGTINSLGVAVGALSCLE